MKINRLLVLDEMSKRGLLPIHSDLKKEFVRLKAGLEGELDLLDWLKRRLGSDVTIIHDLPIKYFNRTQVDIFVVWDEYWWVIEVKNYDGVLEVEEDKNIYNGRTLSVDQIAVMRNRMRIMSDLAHSIDSRIKVEGSFILIHPDSVLRIDKLEDFEILTRNEINHAIGKRINANYESHAWKISRVLKEISKYILPYPEEIPVMSSEMWQDCMKGVRCPKCESYMEEYSKKKLKCPRCHRLEFKCQLVNDVVKQLSILSHNKKSFVSTRNLCQFTNQLIGKSTFSRVMKNKEGK